MPDGASGSKPRMHVGAVPCLGEFLSVLTALAYRSYGVAMSKPTMLTPPLGGTWTKELPEESGFYWYRDDYETNIVEWDVEMEWIWIAGSDIPQGTDGIGCGITGEFWCAC